MGCFLLKTLLFSLFFVFLEAPLQKKVEAVTLNKSIGGEPSSLDPHKSLTNTCHTIKHEIFLGLCTLDSYGNIIPGVAKNWKISPDGKVYTFFLRPDARWSNGDPVTAQDFVYAFQRLVDPREPSPSALAFKDVKNASFLIKGQTDHLKKLGVRALNSQTLEITLENQAPYFLEILASDRGYPLPEKTIKKFGEKWSQPGNMVSNGPFVLKEWIPNDYIKLEKNPYFWDKDSIQIDTIYFHPISDEALELKMFRTGSLDITHYSFQSPASLESIRKKAPEVVKISPTLSLGVYVFNLKKKKMQDPRIREAINLCIDRTLLQKLDPYSRVPAYNLSIPGLKNNLPYRLPLEKMSVSQRHERARKLYKEAGYSDKNPLTLELILPNVPSRKYKAVAIKEMIRKVLGAQVNFNIKERKIYESQVGTDYDLWDLNWRLDNNDIFGFLDQFSMNVNKVNYANYRNPSFEALLQKALHVNNTKTRDEILNEACRILLENNILLPLDFLHLTTLVHPRVQGFHENIWALHASRYLSIDSSKDGPVF